MKTKLAGIMLVASMGGASMLPAQAPQQTPGDGPRAIEARRLPNYVLGPNDEVVIMSLHTEEISNKPYRITTSGDLNLPLVGRVHAAGLTPDQLEAEIAERLKKFVKEPDVAINVTSLKSQPVSVLGMVGSPGIIQLEGRKNLIEVLSQAGGLRAEAGSRVKIMRSKEYGPIPLDSAKTEGDYSVAEVSVRGIEMATSPQENIQIQPNDIITVPRAEVVYVMGEVKKPGGFVLNDRRNISLIEVLARAEGPTSTAALGSAKIIRPVPDGNREEISVNIKDVLKGKSKDITLQPNDILFVGNSYAKGAFRRTLETAIQTTTAIAIYR